MDSYSYYQDVYYLNVATQLAINNVLRGDEGGPFGAVIVKNNTIIGMGVNRVVPNHDATAHAEVQAIRNASRNRGSYDLEGTTLYSNSAPCSMCFSAAYWADMERVVYGTTYQETSHFGFDDSWIYNQMCSPPDQRAIPSQRIQLPNQLYPFILWSQSNSQNYNPTFD